MKKKNINNEAFFETSDKKTENKENINEDNRIANSLKNK
jgi:hypothetical protein